MNASSSFLLADQNETNGTSARRGEPEAVSFAIRMRRGQSISTLSSLSSLYSSPHDTNSCAVGERMGKSKPKQGIGRKEDLDEQ